MTPSPARLRVISRASLLRFFDGASGTSDAMTFIVRVSVDEAGGVTGSAPPSRKIAYPTSLHHFDPFGAVSPLPQANSGTGTLIVERFQLHQDPLDPTEIPHDQLDATFTARRVTAD
jgi:hypothetical protein